MSKSNKQSWPQTTPTSLIPPIFRSKDCRINSRSAGPRTKMVRSTRNHHHHHHSFHYSINHLSILNHTIHHPQRNKHKKESKLRIVLQLHYQQNGKYNDRNTKQDHEHFIYKLHAKHERMISQIKKKAIPTVSPTTWWERRRRGMWAFPRKVWIRQSNSSGWTCLHEVRETQRRGKVKLTWATCTRSFAFVGRRAVHRCIWQTWTPYFPIDLRECSFGCSVHSQPKQSNLELRPTEVP